MYRLTYEEYFPESGNLRSMAPAVDYERVRREHVKSMPIDAVDDSEATKKAKEFIKISGEENKKRFNGGAWPNTAIESVKVIPLS